MSCEGSSCSSINPSDYSGVAFAVTLNTGPRIGIPDSGKEKGESKRAREQESKRAREREQERGGEEDDKKKDEEKREGRGGKSRGEEEQKLKKQQQEDGEIYCQSSQ